MSGRAKSLFFGVCLQAHVQGVFILCGSRKLTYFHGGKRKYSVILTDFGHKNGKGNQGRSEETEISYFRGSENGN